MHTPGPFPCPRWGADRKEDRGSPGTSWKDAWLLVAGPMTALGPTERREASFVPPGGKRLPIQDFRKGLFRASTAAEQATSKHGGRKQWPFLSAHGVRGSGIQTGYSKEGFSLTLHVWGLGGHLHYQRDKCPRPLTPQAVLRKLSHRKVCTRAPGSCASRRAAAASETLTESCEAA